MDEKLRGRIAVVTGGTSGIGLAIARRFADAGATVVVVGRRQAAVDQAVAELGEGAVGHACDVADDQALSGLFAELDRVDLLVTCAGGTLFGTVEEVTPADMRELFAPRVFGQMAAAHFAVPRMRDGGAIVFCSGVGDVVGLVPYSAGCAVDGAVNAFARSLAVELGPSGIRVNAVSPGVVEGTGIEPGKGGRHVEGFNRRALAAIPLGRPARPEDVADAAFHLATSPYATGQVIEIDGGWSAT